MISLLRNVFSTLIVKFFARKIRKYSNLEKLENVRKKIFFEKKTFSSFWKASLTKLEGGKYSGCCRPSCYYCRQRRPKQILDLWSMNLHTCNVVSTLWWQTKYVYIIPTIWNDFIILLSAKWVFRGSFDHVFENFDKYCYGISTFSPLSKINRGYK